jgi:sialate O-acetylesterase
MAALLTAALCVACLGQDNPAVSKLFSDHMVLQREMPVPVWGTAKAGTKVTVKFGAQVKSAEADKDGKWIVRLDALKASPAPAELLIASATGNQPVKITDVVVGDVYLCSGQSNMTFTMNELRAAEDMAKANIPLVRHSRCGDGWAVCSPATIGEFSGVGFYFARKLVQETGIPIGLLNNAVSGSPIEQWIESEGFKSTPTLIKTNKALPIGTWDFWD